MKSETDRFHRSSRTDWLLVFLAMFPSPHMIAAVGLGIAVRGLVHPHKIVATLYTVMDAFDQALCMFLLAGQRRDYIGARALLEVLPPATHMLVDQSYDGDWYREGHENKRDTPCIPSRKGRKIPISHGAASYRWRHKIENSFARLKAWRRVASRYDRCPKLSISALAAVVMFRLGVLTLRLDESVTGR